MVHFDAFALRLPFITAPTLLMSKMVCCRADHNQLPPSSIIAKEGRQLPELSGEMDHRVPIQADLGPAEPTLL